VRARILLIVLTLAAGTHSTIARPEQVDGLQPAAARSVSSGDFAFSYDTRGVSLLRNPRDPFGAILTAPAGRGGRGGGGGGRFGGRGGGPTNQVYAKAGLNKISWNPVLKSLYTVPAGVVSWAHRPGDGAPPKAAIGTYTVKVSSGAWSQTQTFHLDSDPRFGKMTDQDGKIQLDMANEVGGWLKNFYDTIAQLRDAKKQASDISSKTASVSDAAKAFADKATAVEGDMTQLQGSAGQDSLNFPTRMDGQLAELYGAIVEKERKLPKSVTERYADLKDQYNAVLARAAAVLTKDVAAFNAAAGSAGTIVIKK
jgi:hypothetical protein